MTSRFLIAAVVLFTASLPILAQPADGPAQQVIEPAQLAAGPAEAVLPAGAVLHVRLSGVGPLLQDLNDLAMKFLPEKALPPRQQALLRMPNPLLALFTAESMGQPLTPDQLQGALGVDFARPLSVSIYPGDPARSFVVTLPYKDRAAVGGLLSNMFEPTQFDRTDTDRGPVYRLVPGKPDLPPEIFALASADTLYLCASPDFADALLTAPAEQKLARSAFLAGSLQRHQGDNLLIVADLTPLKPALPELRQFRAVPPQHIERMREDAVRDLNERDRATIERQLRARLGIRDIE